MEGKSEKDLAREIFESMLESNAISLEDMIQFKQKCSVSKSDLTQGDSQEKTLKKTRPNEVPLADEIGLDDMMQCERPNSSLGKDDT